MSQTTDETGLHKAAVRRLILYMADRAPIAPSSELTWFVEEWLEEYLKAACSEERDAMVNLFTCASPFAAQSAELREALLRWQNIVLTRAAELG